MKGAEAMPRKTILIVGILVFTLLITACTNNKGASSSSNRIEEVKAYLKNIGPDFENSKNNFKVFDDEYAAENSEQLDELVSTIRQDKEEFEKSLNHANAQNVPTSPDKLKAFHTSLVQYYNDGVKLLNQYEEIAVYSSQIIKITESVEKAASEDIGALPSLEEVKTLIKGMKASIDESIVAIQESNPPDYLVYSHNDFLEVMKQFSIASDNLIFALQLMDPLRMNASQYRFDVLANKMIRIGDDIGQDLDNRMVKIDELGKQFLEDQEKIYKQLLLWQGEYKLDQ